MVGITTVVRTAQAILPVHTPLLVRALVLRNVTGKSVAIMVAAAAVATAPWVRRVMQAVNVRQSPVSRTAAPQCAAMMVAAAAVAPVPLE